MCKSWPNEYGLSKETKVAHLWVKRENIHSNKLSRLSPGKARRDDRERFPGLHGNKRKGARELGEVREQGLREPCQVPTHHCVC